MFKFRKYTEIDTIFQLVDEIDESRGCYHVYFISRQ